MINAQRWFGFFLIVCIAFLPVVSAYLENDGPDFIVKSATRTVEYNKTCGNGNGKISNIELTCLLGGFVLLFGGLYNVLDSSK